MIPKKVKKICRYGSILVLAFFLTIPITTAHAKESDSNQLELSIFPYPPDNRVYTLQELEDAKYRLLTNAQRQNITSVRVDEELNSIVVTVPIGSLNYENGIRTLNRVSEMKKLYIEWVEPQSKPTSEEFRNGPDRQLRIDGGRIFKNRKQLDVDMVGVYDGQLIVTIQDMTEDNKEAVRKIAGESAQSIHFVPIRTINSGFSAFQLEPLTLVGDDPYLYFYGLLIEMENTPFMKEGQLMIPIREVYEILNTFANSFYHIEWKGGEEQEVLFIWNGVTVTELSVKRNAFINSKDSTYEEALDGKAIIQNDTLYIPSSNKNIPGILRVFPNRNTWDAETNTASFYY